jgi:hypothetical protein
MITASTDPRALQGLPRFGQLGDQLGQPSTRDTGEDTMRQGRTGH